MVLPCMVALIENQQRQILHIKIPFSKRVQKNLADANQDSAILQLFLPRLLVPTFLIGKVSGFLILFLILANQLEIALWEVEGLLVCVSYDLRILRIAFQDLPDFDCPLGNFVKLLIHQLSCICQEEYFLLVALALELFEVVVDEHRAHQRLPRPCFQIYNWIHIEGLDKNFILVFSDALNLRSPFGT